MDFTDYVYDNKYCFIMRGLPGSLKSTVAREIGNHSYQYPNGSDVSAIHSTDSYFINEDGEYVFDPTKLGEYHEANYQSFLRSISEGVRVVVVDNTNTQTWEYQKYYDAAAEAGYVVAIVTLPHPSAEVCAERNTHGVPLAAIQAMIDRWEEPPKKISD